MDASVSEHVEYRPVRPPLAPLGAAFGAQCLSLAVYVVGDSFADLFPRHLAGWAISALIGFSLVVVHRRETERRRHEEPLFATRGYEQALGTGLLWAGIVLTGLHAWRLATYFSTGQL